MASGESSAMETEGMIPALIFLMRHFERDGLKKSEGIIIQNNHTTHLQMNRPSKSGLVKGCPRGQVFNIAAGRCVWTNTSRSPGRQGLKSSSVSTSCGRGAIFSVAEGRCVRGRLIYVSTLLC